MDTTLNATRMAMRLREIANAIDTKDWEGVFYANVHLATIAAEFDSFCTAAEEIGSAPSFIAICDWAKGKSFT